MMGLRTILAALAFLLVTASATALGQQSSPKVTPEMFGSLPSISDVVISPDGNTLAVIQNEAGKTAVIFYSLENPSATPTGSLIGEVKARGLVWPNNDRVLLLISRYRGQHHQGAEFARWVSVSKDSPDDVMRLFSKQTIFNYTYGSGGLFSLLPQKENKVLIGNWRAGAQGGYSLYEADVVTGDAKLHTDGNWDTRHWVVNRDGDALARIEYDYDNELRKIFTRTTAADDFVETQVLEQKLGDSARYGFQAAAEKPGQFYVTTTPEKNDKRGLFIYDAAEKSIIETKFQLDNYDVGSIIYDARTAESIGVRYTDDFPRTHYFDIRDKAFQFELETALSGVPAVTSWSADKSKAVIVSFHHDKPHEYYLYDELRGTLDFFSSSYEQLRGISYARTEKYDYTASDGLKIPGYLTLPATSNSRNLPLIVLPHGGPAARDTQAFDWWAHFYAARGYAVYQPNFRGSTGYGRSFREAGHLQWGKKMQSDITEGVEKLIRDGVADSSRICIVGASYGGYAAMAGAAFTPDLYACVVGVSGVYDIPYLLRRQSESGEEWWKTRLGDIKRENKEAYAISPAHHAKNVKAPVLLMHGKDDIIVPFDQSRRMTRLLKKAKKQVTFVELDGEDHWLSRAETRTMLLDESIKFIDRHIGR